MDQGLDHASNMENHGKEIQRICSGTSDRFIPEPSQKYVQDDILVAMSRFKCGQVERILALTKTINQKRIT